MTTSADNPWRRVLIAVIGIPFASCAIWLGVLRFTSRESASGDPSATTRSADEVPAPAVRAEAPLVVPTWLEPCAKDVRGVALGWNARGPRANDGPEPVGELAAVALSTGMVCHSTLAIVDPPNGREGDNVCVTLDDFGDYRESCTETGLRMATAEAPPRVVAEGRPDAAGYRSSFDDGDDGACVVVSHRVPDERAGPSLYAAQAAPAPTYATGPAVEVSGCGRTGARWSAAPDQGRQWTGFGVRSRDGAIVGFEMGAPNATERDHDLVLYDGVTGNMIARIRGFSPSLVCDPTCW